MTKSGSNSRWVTGPITWDPDMQQVSFSFSPGNYGDALDFLDDMIDAMSRLRDDTAEKLEELGTGALTSYEQRQISLGLGDDGEEEEEEE